MCRLTAYIGAEIPLENIIAKPKHSLLVQSHDAMEAKLRVNGDGFGIAWYGHLPEPGLYKDVLPAWSDSNLPSICRLVQSGLFLAHVRAATTGATSRDNCHPFVCGRWSFMHNGGIGDFALLRRRIERLVSDKYYSARRGTTDSELFFLLLLSNGLEDNPLAAVSKTLTMVEKIACEDEENLQPVRLTCVFSDGEKLYAFRYADDNQAPTLYLSQCLDHGGRAFASEPLEGNYVRWHLVDSNTLVTLSRDSLDYQPIFPVRVAERA